MKTPGVEKLLLVTAFMALVPVVAVADQVRKPQIPYTSSWSEEGSFVLNYHGTLADGTLCPRSTNDLQWSISRSNKDADYIHGFSLTKQTDPSFAEAFADNSFCSINFEGKAFFTLNWGKFAQLTPSHILSRDPADMEDGDVPLYEGLMHIVLNKGPCATVPCGYRIGADGRELATVESVIIEDTTVDPLATLTYEGEALPMEGVDGSLWVVDGVANIIAYGFED